MEKEKFEEVKKEAVELLKNKDETIITVLNAMKKKYELETANRRGWTFNLYTYE